MKKNNILLLSLLFSICNFSCFANSEYYEYDFTSKDKTEKVTLRFSSASVNKFPGWKHKRARTVSISMWYPSLIDASSPNVWVSSKQQQANANLKPKPEDSKIKLSLGGVAGGNIVVDPTVTLEQETINSCRIKGSFRTFLEDGSEGVLNRYKFTASNRINSTPHYLYRPKEKIKGIHCIVCNGVTCQLMGITDFGINYKATEMYLKGRMAKHFMEIHSDINRFLSKKIVD